MKKASRTLFSKSHTTSRVEVNSSRSAVGAAIGIALAAVLALSLLLLYPARAEMHMSSASLQLGSPPFANPTEVRSRASEKRLRMVMQLFNGTFTVPNVGSDMYRQFRGWDASQPAPDLSNDSVSPGPTMRVRLGDMVEISFLNKIDDTKFPYTFVTDSPPGRSVTKV